MYLLLYYKVIWDILVLGGIENRNMFVGFGWVMMMLLICFRVL